MFRLLALIAAFAASPATGAELGRDFQVLEHERDLLLAIAKDAAAPAKVELLKTFQGRIVELQRVNPGWSREEKNKVYQEVYQPVHDALLEELFKKGAEKDPAVLSRHLEIRGLLEQKDAKGVLNQLRESSGKRPARESLAKAWEDLGELGVSRQKPLPLDLSLGFQEELEKWVKSWNLAGMNRQEFEGFLILIEKFNAVMSPEAFAQVDPSKDGLPRALGDRVKSLSELALDLKSASGSRSEPFAKLNPFAARVAAFYQNYPTKNHQPLLEALHKQVKEKFSFIALKGNPPRQAAVLSEVRCLQRSSRGTLGAVRLEETSRYLYVLPRGEGPRSVLVCFLYRDAPTRAPAAAVILNSESAGEEMKVPALPKLQPGRFFVYDDVKKINCFLWFDQDYWSCAKAAGRLERASKKAASFGGRSFAELASWIWSNSSLQAIVPWSDGALPEAARLAADPDKAPAEWKEIFLLKEPPPKEAGGLLAAMLEKPEQLPDPAILKDVLLPLHPLEGLDLSHAVLDNNLQAVSGPSAVGPAEGTAAAPARIGLRAFIQEENRRLP